MKTTKILLATLVLGIFFLSCKEKAPELKNTKWVDEKAYTTLEFISDTMCIFYTEGGHTIEFIRETTDTSYIDRYDEDDNFLGSEAIIFEAGTTYEETTEDLAIPYLYEYTYPNISFIINDGVCTASTFREATVKGDVITVNGLDKVILTLIKEKTK